MFCMNCGEAIPDKSENCPKCGAVLNNNQQAVIYASQKAVENEQLSLNTITRLCEGKKVFQLWGALPLLSFIFMAMNYMSISIDLRYSSASVTKYSGYKLMECLEGTARLSGIMMILLILVNVTIIGAAFLGYKGNVVKNSLLNKIMLLQSLCSLVVTIIPYFHINSLLAEFDSDLATTSIGAGCYYNIILSIAILILYFMVVRRNLEDKCN